MTALRTFSALRLWVLAWFVASMGVAIASPLVHPQAFEVICSGTGAIKLLVQTDNGTVEMGAMGMDCPLCFTPSAPPPHTGSRRAAAPPPGPCAAARRGGPHCGRHCSPPARTRAPIALLI